MVMEELENKIKKLYEHVKSGRLTQDIADEMSELVEKVEEMGDDVKDNVVSMVNDMKKALKNRK
jgi:uncharacterized protein Yka (UPF0111/DUF47 family)